MNNELMRQWRANFQAEHGREPSMEEFQAAKEQGFVSEMKQTPIENNAPQTLAEWKDLFVETNGRVPSMEEFQAAKKAFAVEKVAEEQAENVEPVVIPVQPEPVQVHQAVEQPTAAAPVQPTRQQQPKKPMTTKKKVSLTLGAIALVALGGAYAYGDYYFSKESVAQRTASALVDPKAAKYAETLVWEDSKKNLSEAEVAPVVNYMKSEGLKEDKIASKLEGSGLTVAQLQETGKNFLIFPKYEVVVKPVTLTVTSNQGDMTLKVNGTSEGKVNSSKKLEGRAPGIYQFEATAKVDQKEVPVKESRTITSNTTIPLNIELVSFTVQSNMKNGDLYIGDTKVGKLNDGKYKVKNEPITESITVYVTQKFKNANIESEKRELTTADDQMTITLDADGMIDEDNVREVWRSVVSAVDAYASTERVPTNLDMFKGGADNQAFNDFKKNISHNLNNARRVADSITYSFEDVKSFNQTSETEAEYVVEVETRFYYSSDTDKKEHSSGYKTQVFELKGTLYFDDSSNTWQLDTVSEDQKLLKDDDNVS